MTTEMKVVWYILSQVFFKYFQSLFQVFFKSFSSLFQVFFKYEGTFGGNFFRTWGSAWRAKPSQGPRRRAQTGIQCAHRPDGWYAVHYQTNDSFSGLCAESQPRRSWFHIEGEGEMRTKKTWKRLWKYLKNTWKRLWKYLKNTWKRLGKVLLSFPLVVIAAKQYYG